MSLAITRLARWLGWRWLAIVLQRADGAVATLTLPHGLPLSVRSNTDGSVGITVGHDDDGAALLADLQGLMGGGAEHPARLDRKVRRQA